LKNKRLVSWLIVALVVAAPFVFLATRPQTGRAVDTVALNQSASRTEQSNAAFIRHSEILQYDDYAASYGVAVGDADGDGDADIWLTQHGGDGSVILRNRINEKLGKFERIEVYDPGDQHGVTWIDLDRDGYREVFVLRGGGRGGLTKKPVEKLGNRLFVNEGASENDLRFLATDAGDSDEASRGLYYSHGRGRTATFLDSNFDGRLDVFIGNTARSDGGYPSALFVQQDDCTFVVQDDKLGVDGNDIKLAIPADFDGDGRMDLLLIGDRTANAIVLGREDRFQTGAFVLPDTLREARAEDVLVADFNGDTRPDVWVVRKINRNSRGGRDLLFLNTSSEFVEVSGRSGVRKQVFNSRNATAGDFDNDGDIDVYEVNGNYRPDFIGSNLPNVLWENNGNTGVTKVSGERIPVPRFTPHSGPGYAPGEDNGLGATVAMGDFSGDGILDLIVANGATIDQSKPGLFVRGTYDLYFGADNGRNDWLLLDLVGTVSNTEGIGAIVRVTVNGNTYLRTADNGVHDKTQNDPRLHFGLGAVGTDSVKLDILWPSGIQQVINEVSPNQVLKVVEPDAVGGNEIPGSCPS